MKNKRLFLVGRFILNAVFLFVLRVQTIIIIINATSKEILVYMFSGLNVNIVRSTFNSVIYLHCISARLLSKPIFHSLSAFLIHGKQIFNSP